VPDNVAPPDPHDALRRWKRVGLTAALAIAMLIPLAFVRFRLDRPVPVDEQATFAGSAACRECHAKVYDKWLGSHHQKAMAPATDATVLGNFDDATFDYFGTTSRFYRKDGAFRVRTEDESGGMTDYLIEFVFGFYPLQQYLIRFPGGRLQSLTIAWDDVEKQWYHLYPDARIEPGDWLHWTRGAQNWNGMCSECHSTNLRKGYDPDTDTFTTTYSEINVACEACHGPGSLHVAWGKLPAMARPASEDYRLVVSTKGMSSREQVELCAPCHSRRFYLRDYEHEPGSDLLDHLVPSLLDDSLYFPDGQIRDEVYEYASFVQSKMYRHGVRCTDCHDPHTTQRHKEANDLCLQCHRSDTYDTEAHHFHKKMVDGKPSEGWLCQNCHMPQRPYMGIDWRADHSIRVPRPDLSVSIGVPNACTNGACHADKTDAWTADAYAKWYGQARRPHYGTVIAAARRGDDGARADLLKMTQDRLFPAIVRATAISLLHRYPGAESADAVAKALADEESIVRRAALGHADLLPPEARLRLVAPLLADPVRGVRTEAASVFAQTPGFVPDAAQSEGFLAALSELEAALDYQGDFASSGFNRGNVLVALGRFDEAERYYLRSLEIDPLFVRSRVNYAMLLASGGRYAEAEMQLREALNAEPDAPAVAYNLGLLLAETNRLPEAVGFLETAADGMPDNVRAQLNLALAHRDSGDLAAAERGLERALTNQPGDADLLFALGDVYLRQRKIEDALRTARAWREAHPGDERAKSFEAAVAAQR
jgi:tetratricopeptide (TPR) repeat protein